MSSGAAKVSPLGLCEMVPESSSEERVPATGSLSLLCVWGDWANTPPLSTLSACTAAGDILFTFWKLRSSQKPAEIYKTGLCKYKSFSRHTTNILITRHLPLPKWSPSLPAENKLNSNHEIQRKGGEKNRTGRAYNTQMISKTASDAAFVMH